MSRELIHIVVESVDDVTISAQTQFTAEQFEALGRVNVPTLANHEIKRLIAVVREQVASVSPVAVAFTKGGKKFVRRANR